ncbi:MAG: hypothetical protein ACYCT2_05830 [Thermoplasmataceae archaeon]
MTDSQPTGSQFSFINRLREASPERENTFLDFLKERGKTNVTDLTMQEASELIDALKKIKVENDRSGSSYLTGKQLSYLQNLVRDPARSAESERYLKEHRKESLNFLAMDEASELIDAMRNVRVDTPENNSEKPASKKQVQFIKNLQTTDKHLEITKNYLEKLRKVSIDELTSKEASGLIDKLKGA